MTNMDSPASLSLRDRKKAQTRRTIQEQAFRLFLANGYDATTVEEIAAAANVSHMTFFRYFPRKEDVVMSDDYDPLIFEAIAARPAGEAVIDKLRHAFGASLARVYAADRDALLVRTQLIIRTPALRARLWEQQVATEQLIARALATANGQSEPDLRTRVVAAACLAAITTAILVWAEHNGTSNLPELLDQALGLLHEEMGGTNA